MRDQDYPYTKLEGNDIQYYNTADRCFRCPVCNKVFYMRSAEDWVYKLINKQGKTRNLCSYSCSKKAKEQLNSHIDRRKKIIVYPNDFPVNWEFVYARWKDKAITKAEAVRLLNISSLKAFNKLLEIYEFHKLSQEQ